MPVSATGLDVFDRTLQATNVWLNQIMESVGPDRHVAWRVLGSVLRTLRDRLPLGLAAHLGAQLPLLVRGLYYDQWRPSDEPQKWRSLEEFLALVSVDLRDLRPVTPLTALVPSSVCSIISLVPGRSRKSARRCRRTFDGYGQKVSPAPATVWVPARDETRERQR
jgi:uncharacterized protein (DUF2267 family)